MGGIIMVKSKDVFAKNLRWQSFWEKLVSISHCEYCIPTNLGHHGQQNTNLNDPIQGCFK
jgi:hypothetical protein